MKYPGKIISSPLCSEYYGVLFGRASEFREKEFQILDCGLEINEVSVFSVQVSGP
jgi:hypothetical protein